MTDRKRRTPHTQPTGLPGPGGRHRGGRIEQAQDIGGTLRRLLGALKPFRPALGIAGLLVVIRLSLDLAVPLLMSDAIDHLIAGGGLEGLMPLVFWILVAYFGVWLTNVGSNMIMAQVSQKVLKSFRQDLFQHLQTLSLSFFDRHPHGELMSRLTNDLDAISRVLSQNVTDLISGALTLAGILIIMFAKNFWLALGSMIVFPLMTLLMGAVGKQTRKGFREYQKRIGGLNAKLEEIFSGQRVILAFGQEASTLADFDAANTQVLQVGIRAHTYALLLPPLMGILSNANIAILAGLGGWMTLQGLATVGTLVAFYNYSRKFAAPLRQLGNLYNQVQSAIAGAERVFEMLDQRPELTDAPQAASLEEVAGKVRFESVNFGYLPNIPVIKEMSLSAEPGQTVALVGPTGAGKTTIINLLSRFYDIGGGAISIDGHDIREVQRVDLRRHFGVVLQDTFLFTASVMENIRYGRLDASDEEVVAAARLANADQFIRRLPQGYDTNLSERGGNLSQGQRQLLAIARAVLADPSILVLDEATSSVDTRTETHIQEALLRLMEGRTSFVIAHRLSTIRDADKILVINDGRIIERGTHQELLSLGGFYRNLFMSQFKGRTPLEMRAA